MGHALKRRLQATVRSVHVAAFDRGLPRKIGIYGHFMGKEWHARLEELVAELRGRGYAFGDPGAYVADDAPAVFLSFDDNHRSFIDALPVLERAGVKATFYLNSGYFRDTCSPREMDLYFDRLQFFGPREGLSTTEARELRAAGHTVGAHTRSHLPLTRLPAAAARDEIRRGKEELEGLLGEPVRHFAYPFGMGRYFNEELRSYCREIGFATVANAVEAVLHRPLDPFALNRTSWRFEHSLAYNLLNLAVDGRWFEAVTGRSAIG